MSTLRRWQDDALDTLERQDKQNQSVMAFTGAGKTHLALEYARRGRIARKWEHLLVVTPRDELRRHWVESAAEMGTTLLPFVGTDFNGAHGAVTTYQQIVTSPKLVRALVMPRNHVFVALDEIHHAAGQQAWGTALRTALQHAVGRLSLTATPFRHSEGQIAFIEYQDGQAVVDFAYPFKAALTDGVVSPLEFELIGGSADWSRKKQKGGFIGGDLSDQDLADQLRTILEPRGDWLPEVIEMADRRLLKMRSGNRPLAKGQVVCMDTAHADQVARIVERVSGEPPTVVHTGLKDATELLYTFKVSPNRWLVVVGMGIEGYDNVNLKVGVWATNVTTALSLYQWAGRFARISPHVDGDQTGVLYIPDHPRLKEYAESIDEVRYHTLEEVREKQQRERAASQKAGAELTPIKSQAAFSRSITHGGLDLVAAIRQRVTSPALDAITDEAIRAIAEAVLSLAQPMAVESGEVRDDPFVARQRAEFMKLIKQINKQPKSGRLIFAYLLQLKSGEGVMRQDLARNIVQKDKYLEEHPEYYLWFVRQGLVIRDGLGPEAMFYLGEVSERFNRLDLNWMLRQLGQINV